MDTVWEDNRIRVKGGISMNKRQLKKNGIKLGGLKRFGNEIFFNDSFQQTKYIVRNTDSGYWKTLRSVKAVYNAVVAAKKRGRKKR